ncbi:MAG: hypothetical protein L3K14_06085 [Thermoplasmata archaeon]|nr:hypothetical protein [Thermoplasmata archaeon]
MRQFSRACPRRLGKLLPVLSVALLALMLAPYGASFVAPARGATPGVVPGAGGSLSGQLTWNGANTNSAPNPSSAISWTFTNVATAVFSWTGPVGGAGVSQAFLVVVFFGASAYTKQQVESPALPSAIGSISMTYDLTQFKWYLQGLFQIHAYLEDPSGNDLWGETFYVRVAQPYDVVVATVGLILITLAELYMIATVGPRAADKTRKEQQSAPEPADATKSTPDSAGTPPGSN